jgi:hypothetical protein
VRQRGGIVPDAARVERFGCEIARLRLAALPSKTSISASVQDSVTAILIWETRRVFQRSTELSRASRSFALVCRESARFAGLFGAPQNFETARGSFRGLRSFAAPRRKSRRAVALSWISRNLPADCRRGRPPQSLAGSCTKLPSPVEPSSGSPGLVTRRRRLPRTQRFAGDGDDRHSSIVVRIRIIRESEASPTQGRYGIHIRRRRQACRQTVRSRPGAGKPSSRS